MRVRYRYDGQLHEAESQPAQAMRAITSRIKIMARLDIAEQRLPQDGRIKLAVRGHEIDIRVSTIPALHGETVALRILDRSVVALDYDVLGLPQAIVDKLDAALALHNGIVLVTGADRLWQDDNPLYRASRPERDRPQDRYHRGPD